MMLRDNLSIIQLCGSENEKKKNTHNLPHRFGTFIEIEHITSSVELATITFLVLPSLGQATVQYSLTQKSFSLQQNPHPTTAPPPPINHYHPLCGSLSREVCGKIPRTRFSRQES